MLTKVQEWEVGKKNCYFTIIGNDVYFRNGHNDSTFKSCCGVFQKGSLVTKEIFLHKTGIAHNLSPFEHEGVLYAIGGVDHWPLIFSSKAVSKEDCEIALSQRYRYTINIDPKKWRGIHRFIPNEEVKYSGSLYLLRFDNQQWTILDPIIELHDVIRHAAWAIGTFDGAHSVFYDPLIERFRIYLRANTKKNVRFIQTATSVDLYQWNDFRLIDLEEGFKPNIDSYYTANGFYYFDGIGYLAFLPYIDRRTGNESIKIAKSTDGIRWTTHLEVLKDKASYRDKAKTYKPYRLPVRGGVYEQQGKLYFYVHENYFSFRKNETSMIVQYYIDKESII